MDSHLESLRIGKARVGLRYGVPNAVAIWHIDFGDVRLSMFVNCVMHDTFRFVGAAIRAIWKDVDNSAPISIEDRNDIRSLLDAIASKMQNIPGRIKRVNIRLEVDNDTCVLAWDNVCTNDKAWIEQTQKLLEIVRHVDEDWTKRNCERCGMFFPPPFRHVKDPGHCDICSFVRKRCAKVIGREVKEALANPYCKLGKRRLENEWKMKVEEDECGMCKQL